MDKPKIGKPLYVVALGDGLYYSKDSAWKGVRRKAATRLTHKQANRISSHLKQPKIGYAAYTEALAPHLPGSVDRKAGRPKK